MPDGSPARLSFVERALQLPGYRALRRKLQGPLRRKLPLNPPESMAERCQLVRAVLRERRRMLADEAAELEAQGREPAPRLTVRISDAARFADRDRSTVTDWLADSNWLTHEHGKIVIEGEAALSVAAEYFPKAPPVTEAEAVARLAELAERNRDSPVEPFPKQNYEFYRDEAWSRPRHLPEGTRKIADPPYPDLGAGGPTVGQLAAILAEPNTLEPGETQRHAAARVRQMLRDLQFNLPPGERLPVAWLATREGEEFWRRALALNPEVKELWLRMERVNKELGRKHAAR